MPDAAEDEDDGGGAVHRSADQEALAVAPSEQDLHPPGLAEAQREAADHQHDERDRQHPVLQGLVERSCG